jgi:excisionase family DNA binding protein
MTTVETEWLTVAEASAYLRVTRATLYRWAREGRVRLYKLGGRTTRVRRSDLDGMASPRRHAQGQAWTKLSEESFARDWDNDKDAVYDNWRELYGVPEG